MKPIIKTCSFYSKSNSINEDILYLEKELKANLPLSYKEFLLEYDGGLPQPYFLVSKYFKENIFDVGRFLNTEFLKLDLIDSNVPIGYIDIAYDGGGNSYCLSLQSSYDYGKVYFLDHEKDENECLKLLADSFEEFINSFQEDED